jgi:hypothetical protein
MQSGLGQSAVGRGTLVGLGVALGEKAGMTTTGLGLGSGMGAGPQADRIQIVNNKGALILDFIIGLNHYGEGVKVGRGVGVNVTVGVAVL